MTSVKQPGKLSLWVQAARPRTLPLSLSGIITGSALGYAVGQFSWKIFIPAILTTVLLQILSNFANDLGDAQKGTDHENRVGPQRVVQSGLISKSAILRAIVITAVLAFISGISLLNFAFGQTNMILFTIFLILGLSAILAAVKYTMGKKPYGYMGLGDLFVMIFFGFVGVCGSYFLYAQEVSFAAILQSLIIGSFSTAVLHLNNMRDLEEDEKSGKRTLAVKLGNEEAKRYFTWLIVTINFSVFIYSILFIAQIFELIFIPALIPAWMIVQKVRKNENRRELNNYLKPVALSAFAYSVLLFIGLML